MVDTKVTLCGIEIDNPIIPASGTFGYGYEFAELYDINILGAFSFKGTTKEARFGNPTPRIAECKSGMINSVGLQNPGVDKVISEELPKLAKVFNKKVMANVSGFAIDEFVDKLGDFPVPVEVLPDASRMAIKELEDMGAECEIRMAQRKDGPVITDNGNQILDCTWDKPINVAEMEDKINSICGVVENGLFSKNLPIVFVAKDDGTVEQRNWH